MHIDKFLWIEPARFAEAYPQMSLHPGIEVGEHAKSLGICLSPNHIVLGALHISVETEHSDKELYRITAQSRPVQMISY